MSTSACPPRPPPPARWLWLCLALLMGAAGAATAEHPDKGLLIEAGFISKFPAFISWPGEEAPFRFCTLGPTPLAAPLASVLRHTRIRGARPQLREVDPDTAADCHLLYIPPDRRAALPQIVERLAGRPVLTVGDSPGLARQGVHINLYRKEGRIRFEVNPAALHRAGLRASFRLLEMARVIE